MRWGRAAIKFLPELVSGRGTIRAANGGGAAATRRFPPRPSTTAFGGGPPPPASWGRNWVSPPVVAPMGRVAEQLDHAIARAELVEIGVGLA